VVGDGGGAWGLSGRRKERALAESGRQAILWVEAGGLAGGGGWGGGFLGAKNRGGGAVCGTAKVRCGRAVGVWVWPGRPVVAKEPVGRWGPVWLLWACIGF